MSEAAVSPIVEVNEANFAVEVEQATIPVFVDFWAPWCAPCRDLEPLFEKLAHTYDGQIKFAKINYDESKGLVERFNVRGLPSLLLLRSGEEIERNKGMRDKSHLSNLLDKYVTTPVTAAMAPVRRFRAFYGDAPLRDTVMARVRAHIENDRIIFCSIDGADIDVGKQHYSLTAAALESKDAERYEGTLGIPASVARLAAYIHSFQMHAFAVDGEAQYHLRGEGRFYHLDWLQAIPLGADLGTLVSRFAHWNLMDMISGTYLYGVKAIPETHDIVRRVASLHGRHANGDAPTSAQWKDIRREAGEVLERVRAETEEKFSRNLLHGASLLAWPAEEMDDVSLLGLLGLIKDALVGKATLLSYAPEQWAQRMALEKAAQDKYMASPKMPHQELMESEEFEALRALLNSCEPKDTATKFEVNHVYGTRLHQGLMLVLAQIAEAKR